MSALPAEAVIRAARRWAELLTYTDVEGARALLTHGASYTDLTMTQYGQGYELLAAIGAVDESHRLNEDLAAIGRDALPSELAREIVAHAGPAWLTTAEELIFEPEDLPIDSRVLGIALGLSEQQTWSIVQAAANKVDTERRAQIGLAGEVALHQVLNEHGIVADHVSLRSDTLGYDIAVRCGTGLWHVEVKSTTSRAQLTMFLSRHEYETSLRDPRWVLVALVLDDASTIIAGATVDIRRIAPSMPVDQASGARWESARLRLPTGAADVGLTFLAGCGPEDLVTGRAFRNQSVDSVWWLD